MTNRKSHTRFRLVPKSTTRRHQIFLFQSCTYKSNLNVRDTSTLRTDGRTTYDSNAALALRASRGKNSHCLRLLNTLCQSRVSTFIQRSIVLCFQPLTNGFNSNLINAFTESTDITRGRNFKIIKQTCSVDAIKRFFANQANAWNTMVHIVSSPTLSTFKSRLFTLDLSYDLSKFKV